MAPTAAGAAGPLAIYRRMQEAVLQGDGASATLLPAELLADDLVVETPFATPGMRRYEGREAWLSYYETSGAGLPVRFEQFRELATYRTTDTFVVSDGGRRSPFTAFADLGSRCGGSWYEQQVLRSAVPQLRCERSYAAVLGALSS